MARTGSITTAAQQLLMTQPPLSQAIAALEKDLGVKLLYRQPRGVALTAAGELLAQDGQALFDWQNHIIKNVQDTGHGFRGVTQPGCYPCQLVVSATGFIETVSRPPTGCRTDLY